MATATAPALLLSAMLLAAVAPGTDDLKIEAHWWTSWDRGSTITYIHDDSERTESCWGQHDKCDHPTEISLRQCGVWSALSVRGTFYDTSDINSTGAPPLPVLNNDKTAHGVVRVTIQSVDTGDRKPMLGYTARHIVTTATIDTKQSTCSVRETEHSYDGWYIDTPYSNKCTEREEEEHRFEAEFESISECGDQVTVEHTGSKLGLGLSESEEYRRGGNKFGGGYTVTSISHEHLDPVLFAKPHVQPSSELVRGREAK